jgi:hypothetical protein
MTNSYSAKMEDMRSRMLDAEAILHFMRKPEHIQNLLEGDSPDVVIGALMERAWSPTSSASGDYFALIDVRDEDLGAELHRTALELIADGSIVQIDKNAPGAGLTNHIEHIDKLDESHEQTKAMLSVLMLYLGQAGDGWDILNESVITSYAWQMMNNMERAKAASTAIHESLKA